MSKNTTNSMQIRFTGAGIWAPGITNFAEFLQVIHNDTDLSAAETIPPPADIIPPREKRRVPMNARLAIEAGMQACRMAKAEPAEVATVFSSVMGDVKVTDYMCRTLATAEKAISPTQFHNSVHNATCGYWSIFTGGRRSGGFACGYSNTFTAGLLEAATMVHTEQQSTLLICYDIASTYPLQESCPIDINLAYALLLEPASSTQGKLAELTVTAGDTPSSPAPVFNMPGLTNPVSDGLAVLEQLGSMDTSTLTFKSGSASLLRVELGSGSLPSVES